MRYSAARWVFSLGRSLFKPSIRLTLETSPLRFLSSTRAMAAKVSVFGSWESPISSKLVSESSVSFQEVHVDTDPGNSDTVYWTELRYDEGGRYVVCSRGTADETLRSWTPKELNARTRVHEYGGGASFVSQGVVYFSNFKDQRMYMQDSPDNGATPLTEEGKCRYADGQFNLQTGRIYCVREDHTGVEEKQVKEAVNTIVSVSPLDGSQTVLASGADFYSSPRVSPDGKKIVWVQWYHPNMPWDSTELWLAELSEEGDEVVAGSSKKIVSGENLSVMCPSWTCDNQLLYISDETDWWNLYLMSSDGSQVNLLPKTVELGGPQWVFGRPAYAVDPRGNGDIVTVFGKELGVLNVTSRSYRTLETGFSTHSCVNVSGDGNIYCVAGSPTRFPCVIRVHPDTGKVDILRKSKSLSLDTGYFSVPEEISWETAGNEVSYGYLYLPANKDFSAPAGTLPPLLVKNHGGPTSQSSNMLDLKIQYFTSRGMAVLDVNYRGSTGYGKQYRHRLRKNWGVCDVEDASSGAQHLADSGKVDGKRLCIDGGSAGGYTTLACLTFKDVFNAGASHYGIGDLQALVADTHKFESRYVDTLIAPCAEEASKKIYEERSPIRFVGQLNCPLALFQGDEDEIVPPNQAEMMYEAVKRKGLPCMYVLFRGEQHGFRKSENIQTALDGEFYFFSKVFGFEAADKHIKLPIDNLKA